MSKSLGNLYTLQELKEKGYSPEEVRYVLLSGSYRQHLNFTLDSLDAARKALGRLRDLKEKLGSIPEGSADSLEDVGPFRPVIDALLNDLNTPDALGQLFTIAKQLQKGFDELDEDSLQAARRGFAHCLFALGLRLEAPAAPTAEIPEHIEKLAEERWQAKQNKEWARSDELRDEIVREGWKVTDSKEGYTLTQDQ